jgi:hypothetical protein
MTTQKLIQVFQFYANWLDEVKNVVPLQMNHDPCNYAHLAWMCDKSEYEFIPEGPDGVSKAMRWLGFIQGVLCVRGDFTLDDLRAHSRSEEQTE